MLSAASAESRARTSSGEVRAAPAAGAAAALVPAGAPALPGSLAGAGAGEHAASASAQAARSCGGADRIRGIVGSVRGGALRSLCLANMAPPRAGRQRCRARRVEDRHAVSMENPMRLAKARALRHVARGGRD
jgi:hypothetical protein